MTAADIHFSRAAATAALLGGSDSHRFVDKRVLLTGDIGVLSTANGSEMARSALQLLMRSCRNVSVAVPHLLPGIAGDLRADGARFAWDNEPTFVSPDDGYDGYNAILSIGPDVRPDLPWTAITSNGWLVRVSSGVTVIAGDCAQTNAVGALAAASIGVCEVFKRLIRLKPDLGELLDGVTFSLWDYEFAAIAPGPALGERMVVDLMLNGAGAIGSAVIHLLARLPVGGQITVVDNQDYGDENWGTCLDLERGQPGNPKAKIAAARLPPRLVPHPFKATVDDVRKGELGKSVPWPKVVLNGLDKIDARHHAQRIWPEIAIDGALDADLQVRVSAHPWPADVACLICTFTPPPGESAEVAAARVTGLSVVSVTNQDRPLTEADIQAAAPEKRDSLRAKLGKKICSIVSEEIARSMSEGQVDEGFSPSVPFAACFSACMMVTELVRYLTDGKVRIRPSFQMSMLRGPETGQRLNDCRHADCYCVRYGEHIDNYRRKRTQQERAA
jgi:hypothetical protein